MDDIAIYPVDAQITTYTYDPLAGMTSETDSRGYTIYYEYDDLQRLRNVKDNDGNIVKSICYNYAGQSVGCGINVTYQSSAKSKTFLKNDCSPGYIGSSYSYSVPANKYQSSISQADAERKADADLNINGQMLANSTGTCTQVIYARLEHYMGEWSTTQTYYGHIFIKPYYIYIKLFSDPNCTQPLTLGPWTSFYVDQAITEDTNPPVHTTYSLSGAPGISSIYFGDQGLDQNLFTEYYHGYYTRDVTIRYTLIPADQNDPVQYIVVPGIGGL